MYFCLLNITNVLSQVHHNKLTFKTQLHYNKLTYTIHKLKQLITITVTTGI